MKSQMLWSLLVSFLLGCGMIRGAEKPQPDVEAATEKAVAAQKECSQRLRLPVEITNSIGMKLKLIPEGEFLMGSPASERRGGDELQHRVQIAEPFYLGCYEVTQAKYERVMKTNPSRFSPQGERKGDVVGLDTSRFPVENVSWLDAAEFCRRLSKLPEEKAAGRIYRLPTDAEWEYACRAGTTTRFHFGNQLTKRQANIFNCHVRTTTVGTYAPNAFGLYNMHGNVVEWCNGWYKTCLRSSPRGDPQTNSKPEHQHRVVRGGSWMLVAKHCRAAGRRMGEPHIRTPDLGFRVAALSVGEFDATKEREK